MKTSEAVSEISKAFAVMQAELKPAAKDAVNPAFRSKYADLAAVWDACRGPLAKNGLFVTQDVTSEPKRVSVTTRVMHITGQWFEYSPFSVPVEKETAHGIGSATSYAKRYSLSAALGVVAENDDDGNAASESTQTKSQAVAARIPPAKEWHPVDGPPPPSDEDRPPDAGPVVMFNQSGEPVPVHVIDWGRNRGTPITDLNHHDFLYHLGKARDDFDKCSSDETKKRFLPKAERLYGLFLAEQRRRGSE